MRADHLCMSVCPVWPRAVFCAAGSQSSSSHESTELINKLAPLVKPMLLEWEQISCIYSTGKGTKAVLTVSGQTSGGCAALALGLP
jgi:hypothetical protein